MTRNKIFRNLLQSKATGVVVDFTDPTTVYDNVKQVLYHLNLLNTIKKDFGHLCPKMTLLMVS